MKMLVRALVAVAVTLAICGFTAPAGNAAPSASSCSYPANPSRVSDGARHHRHHKRHHHRKHHHTTCSYSTGRAVRHLQSQHRKRRHHKKRHHHAVSTGVYHSRIGR